MKLENCKAGNYKAFGEYVIKETETIDGFKYHLGKDRNVMIRPSGTEPVLRTYAEAPTLVEVRHILENCKSQTPCPKRCPLLSNLVNGR
mgnify:CR=1 FL=1